MKQLRVDFAEVVSGDLYERISEDGLIVVYDQWIEAVCDGVVYRHNFIFKGYFTTEDCIDYADMAAGYKANKLLEKIHSFGYININHWGELGAVSDLEAAHDRKFVADMCDNSDHWS